jgi:hypothetical protein
VATCSSRRRTGRSWCRRSTGSSASSAAQAASGISPQIEAKGGGRGFRCRERCLSFGDKVRVRAIVDRPARPADAFRSPPVEDVAFRACPELDAVLVEVAPLVAF